MTEMDERPVRVPPRWFMHAFWKGHRAWYRVTRGRRGLWRPTSKRRWGALQLTAVGRRSGRPRGVMLGYLEDGPDLVVLAMNGWGDGEPAWWLNLQAHPAATVHLAGSAPRQVSAHAAEGAERERLWDLWRTVTPELDAYAALRSTPVAVVVLSSDSAPRR
jgi:deazaflavin-dependent oxidoreductase (nitroreductase family)